MQPSMWGNSGQDVFFPIPGAPWKEDFADVRANALNRLGQLETLRRSPPATKCSPVACCVVNCSDTNPTRQRGKCVGRHDRTLAGASGWYRSPPPNLVEISEECRASRPEFATVLFVCRVVAQKLRIHSIACCRHPGARTSKRGRPGLRMASSRAAAARWRWKPVLRASRRDSGVMGWPRRYRVPLAKLPWRAFHHFWMSAGSGQGRF